MRKLLSILAILIFTGVVVLLNPDFGNTGLYNPGLPLTGGTLTGPLAIVSNAGVGWLHLSTTSGNEIIKADNALLLNVTGLATSNFFLTGAGLGLGGNTDSSGAVLEISGGPLNMGGNAVTNSGNIEL